MITIFERKQIFLGRKTDLCRVILLIKVIMDLSYSSPHYHYLTIMMNFVTNLLEFLAERLHNLPIAERKLTELVCNRTTTRE